MTVPIRFIRMPELIHKVGLSRSQIYRLVSTGNFPEQRKVGSKVSVWVESEIDAWMAQQEPHRDADSQIN